MCVCFRIQQNSKHLKHNESLNWSPESGYSADEMDTYPRRALASGSYSGLSLLVGMEDEDIDPVCSYSIHGMLVSICTTPNVLGLRVRYY